MGCVGAPVTGAGAGETGLGVQVQAAGGQSTRQPVVVAKPWQAGSVGKRAATVAGLGAQGGTGVPAQLPTRTPHLSVEKEKHRTKKGDPSSDRAAKRSKVGPVEQVCLHQNAMT